MMPGIEKLDRWLMQHGQDLNLALIIVLGAVLAASLLVRLMQSRMRGYRVSEHKVILTTRGVYVVFTMVGLLVALHTLGLQWVAIRRIPENSRY